MWAKPFLLTYLIFTSIFTDGFKQNVRDMYVKSVTDKQQTQVLLNLLSKQEQTPFVLGYTGATKMIMSKHAFNPFTKLSYFNSGKKMLQSAIARDKNNAELLFLRYAIQVSAPGILGYNDSISADKRQILIALNNQSVDEKMAKSMVSFMKNQQLTVGEQQLLLNIFR